MAPSGYAVSIHIAPRFARHVRRRTLAALARRALAAESVRAASELSIVITDNETVRELNRRFRGEDTPTDVLSFELGPDDGFVAAEDKGGLLGEVVISYQTAARQAAEAGRDVEDELAHLLVHGLLHLLGYDHRSTREAGAMRAREESLLGRPAH